MIDHRPTAQVLLNFNYKLNDILYVSCKFKSAKLEIMEMDGGEGGIPSYAALEVCSVLV